MLSRKENFEILKSCIGEVIRGLHHKEAAEEALTTCFKAFSERENMILRVECLRELINLASKTDGNYFRRESLPIIKDVINGTTLAGLKDDILTIIKDSINTTSPSGKEVIKKVIKKDKVVGKDCEGRSSSASASASASASLSGSSYSDNRSGAQRAGGESSSATKEFFTGSQ